MSFTEVDVPVLASPEQIRRREFVTTRRGYDPDQVREYLGQVALQVERMEKVIRSACSEAEANAHAQPRAADAYQELATRLAGLVRTADGEAERIRREAEEEAERTLREARADADRIRLDAQSKAEEAREAANLALEEARERANRTIAGLDLRRNTLTEQLSEMQTRLLTVAKELESAIDRREETVAIADVEEEVAVTPETAEVAPATEIPAGSEFEELWTGVEAMDIAIPEIPPLDLRWGDEAG